jgi:hypothetical protein
MMVSARGDEGSAHGFCIRHLPKPSTP